MKSLVKLLCILIFIVGCSETDEDKLGDAQICMSSATPTNVDDCLSKIDGLTSAKAYQIRCSAHYVRQNFNEQTWINVTDTFINSAESDSGQTPITAVAPFLAFEEIDGVDDSANTLVENAISDCTASGSSGMILFSSISSVATTLASAITLDPDQSLEDLEPEDYEEAIKNLDTEDSESLGESVLLINDQYCSGSSTSNADFCEDLEQVEGDDSETVGNKAKCVIEFTEADLLTANGVGSYTNCTDCNRQHCRFLLELTTTDPTNESPCNGAAIYTCSE